MTLPTTMRALTIPKYGPPSSIVLSQSLPLPTLTPGDVLIRVAAVGLNPGDIKLASGVFSLMHKFAFPYTIGHDLSGTVVAVAEPTTDGGVGVGDEVVAMLPITRGGAAAEYVVASRTRVAVKPVSILHSAGAALPGSALTASQALERAHRHLPGGLAGKTVLVAGALGGIGVYVAQIAKHVYSAGTVIGSVSTPKISRVEELLGADTVDVVVDYTTAGGVVGTVERASVDVYIDTAPSGSIWKNISVVKPGGVVVSCVALCDPREMDRLFPGVVPVVLKWVMGAAHAISRWRAGRWGVVWQAQLTALDERAQLEEVVQWVLEGKVKAVVDRSVNMREEGLAEIRALAAVVGSGSGQVGKTVITIE